MPEQEEIRIVSISFFTKIPKMKETLLIIVTIILAIITYFISKLKGWWNLLSNTSGSSNIKSIRLTKLTQKARSLDSTVNEYVVDTAIIQISRDGKDAR